MRYLVFVSIRIRAAECIPSNTVDVDVDVDVEYTITNKFGL